MFCHCRSGQVASRRRWRGLDGLSPCARGKSFGLHVHVILKPRLQSGCVKNKLNYSITEIVLVFRWSNQENWEVILYQNIKIFTPAVEKQLRTSLPRAVPYEELHQYIKHCVRARLIAVFFSFFLAMSAVPEGITPSQPVNEGLILSFRIPSTEFQQYCGRKIDGQYYVLHHYWPGFQPLWWGSGGFPHLVFSNLIQLDAIVVIPSLTQLANVNYQPQK